MFSPPNFEFPPEHGRKIWGDTNEVFATNSLGSRSTTGSTSRGDLGGVGMLMSDVPKGPICNSNSELCKSFSQKALMCTDYSTLVPHQR